MAKHNPSWLLRLIEKHRNTLPDWADEKGVAELAGEIIADARAETQTIAQRFLNFGERVVADDDDRPSDQDAHWPAADRKELNKFIKAERAAVKAALHGDPAPLAELLLSEHLEWLQPRARNLVAEFLTGKRNLLTGKPKLGRGNPKKPRKKRSPTHGAEAEAQFLKQHLRELYPKIRLAKLKARADEIATKRAGVTTETLRGYRRRPRGGAHRIV
jgi:hypothetical protein